MLPAHHQERREGNKQDCEPAHADSRVADVKPPM